MSNDVTLTTALKNSLLSLQQTRTKGADDRPVGTTVPSPDQAAPTDDRSTLLNIQGLNNRATNLQGVLDNISDSVKTLEAAENAVSKIEELLSEAESLIQANIDAGQVEPEFPERYTSILGWIESVAEKARFRGVNLLDGDDLVTTFSDSDRGALVTQGDDFTVSGLGINQADPTSAGEQKDLLDDVRLALQDVQAFGRNLREDIATVKARRDFTEQTLSTLNTGVDNLNLSDQDEEGAALLALQTRLALSQSDYSLASPAQQDVIRLF